MQLTLVGLVAALATGVSAAVDCDQYDNSGYAIRWPKGGSGACPNEAPIRCTDGLTNRCCPTGTVCYEDGPAWCCPRGMSGLERRNSVIEFERVRPPFLPTTCRHEH